MSSITDALPGITLPISEISKTLSNMWKVETTPNLDAPSEFRASQMNVILHMGRETSVEEAIMRFYTTILFAQRYPCRIIVLFPESDSDSQEAMLEGKLFTQCFIGEGLREMCCCEAVIVGYYMKQQDYLENQISVWLENDLPTYYWFNRVPTDRIKDRWLDFAKNFTRIVYDTSIEDEEFQTISWPNPSKCHDLALARILQLRQSIGQFISSYKPNTITENLTGIQITHDEHLVGEVRSLASWLDGCIQECGDNCSDLISTKSRPDDGADSTDAIELIFEYSDDKQLEWRLDKTELKASLKTNLSGHMVETPMQVKLLDLDKALAEALFFN